MWGERDREQPTVSLAPPAILQAAQQLTVSLVPPAAFDSNSVMQLGVHGTMAHRPREPWPSWSCDLLTGSPSTGAMAQKWPTGHGSTFLRVGRRFCRQHRSTGELQRVPPKKCVRVPQNVVDIRHVGSSPASLKASLGSIRWALMAHKCGLAGRVWVSCASPLGRS